MKVVVIIPTYNEKGNIDRLIQILEEEIFSSIKNHEMYILVADDNSPDGTAEVVKKLMEKYKNIELNSGEKKGLGAAYVRAMTYAIETMQADVMFEFDADLSHDPKKIPAFLQKIDEGYDMVIGNRYSDGGSIPQNWPPARKAFSIVANLFVRIVFLRLTIHDWTGGFRALKKEVFLKEKNELEKYNGYIFQISFLHKVVRDGFRIGEVPFSFTDRTLGRSKIAPAGYIFDVLKFVIVTRIKEIIFGKFGKFLVVGGFGFIINAMTLRVLVEYIDWHPAPANLVGAAFAIFSNYNFNNIWTFRERRSRTLGMYLFRMIEFYASSSFGVVVIQTGTIFLGTALLGKEFYFIYFLIGTSFLLLWNFTMYNRVIWRKKSASQVQYCY
ncbi:MAG: glycosyltransferase [Candidatus Levybacteria bacterium]|nr:glycosyltransferase [Candidatus Levybacteria bacterium]